MKSIHFKKRVFPYLFTCLLLSSGLLLFTACEDDPLLDPPSDDIEDTGGSYGNTGGKVDVGQPNPPVNPETF